MSGPAEAPMSGPSVRRRFVVYTAARVAVFVALVALCWAVGLSGFLGLLIALVASVPVSLVLLRRQRQGLADAIAAHAGHRAESKAALRAQLRGDAA